MNNPFEEILAELRDIKTSITTIQKPADAVPPEIIDTEELCKRLNITAPTARKWRLKKKIPSFKLGDMVRYNWPRVIESLETKGTK